MSINKWSRWLLFQLTRRTASPVRRPLVEGLPHEPAHGIRGSDNSCKCSAWSVIDNNVTGLSMMLPYVPVTSSNREPRVGAQYRHRQHTGDISIVIRGHRGHRKHRKKRHASLFTQFGDSCTDQMYDSCEPAWLATEDKSSGTFGAS